MNTFDTIGEEIEIENILVKKWVNVILQCDGKNLDVWLQMAPLPAGISSVESLSRTMATCMWR